MGEAGEDETIRFRERSRRSPGSVDLLSQLAKLAPGAMRKQKWAKSSLFEGYPANN